MTHLEWTCHSCGFPITGGDGAIVADYSAIQHIGRTIPFRPLHWACTDDDGYSVDVAHIRTEEEVLWWTRHLFTKDWFARSTWDDILTIALTREETA